MFWQKKINRFGYTQLNYGIKAAFWYVIANLSQKFIAFICTPIYTRYLSVSQYGQYELYKSWFNIILVFTTLNLFYSGFTTGIAQYEDDGDNFTSSMVGICSFTLVIVSCIFLMLQHSFRIVNIEYSYCIAMIMEMWGFAVFNFWATKERFFYQYRKLVVISIGLNLLINGCSVIAIINLHSSDKLFYKIYIESFSWLFIGIYCLCNILKKSKLIFNLKYWRFGLIRNVPLIPHYLSNIILNQSDKIMISLLWDNAAAAKYSLAYSIAMFLTALSTSIQNAFNPFLYRCLKNKKMEHPKIIIVLLGIFFLILCSLIILIAPEFIIIMAPDSYWDAKYVMPPVICTVLFIFLNSVFTGIEHYYGKTKPIFLMSFGIAVLNIILNFILIPKYGYVAAGYTTLGCYYILSNVHMFVSRGILMKDNIVNGLPIKELHFISMVSIGFTLIFTMLYSKIWIRILLICLILVTLILLEKRIVKTIKNLLGKVI